MTPIMNSFMNPIIGIIVCGQSDERQYISSTYIEAIQHAGGLPILIPLVHSRTLITKYISLCNGFLFCGGDDITPLLFGEDNISSSNSTDLSFDLFQISLMRNALSARKPILAICRGMQVLNVALGGTIYQDLSLRKKCTYNHMQHSSNRSDISHRIHITSGTVLHRCLQMNHLYTNSFHHQAVHHLGKKLMVSATSSDGVIEAIELTHLPFVIGVQWHPECMVKKSKSMQNLFRSFIAIAGQTDSSSCLHSRKTGK